MSKTGEYGDKAITYLHGDGHRRHKKHCSYYDNGHCGYYSVKCSGSSHCTHYRETRTMPTPKKY